MQSTLHPLQPYALRRVDVHHDGADWTLHCYDAWSDWLLNGYGSLKPEHLKTLIPFLNWDMDQPFYWPIVLGSEPALVAVWPNEKEMRLYTPQAANELFTIEKLYNHLLLENDSSSELRVHIGRLKGIEERSIPSQWEFVSDAYGLRKDISPEALATEFQPEYQKQLDDLLGFMREYSPTIFERISDVKLGWVATYAILRIHLLKFIVILPILAQAKNNAGIKARLIEALHRTANDSARARDEGWEGQRQPLADWMEFCLPIAKTVAIAIPANALAPMIEWGVRFLAKRFIAGENITEAEATIKELHAQKRDITLDPLGELIAAPQEADEYYSRVLALIKGYKKHIVSGEKNKAGILKAHISIKVSALTHDFNPNAPETTYHTVAPRVKSLLITAKNEQVFMNIDAEHYTVRDLTLYIYRRVLLETPELHSWDQTGIVVQSYLRDAHPHVMDIVELAKKRGCTLAIRLVKGAYWDAETIEAEAHGNTAPQFLNKEETDLHCRQMILTILEQSPHVQLCLGSHNFADHAFAETARHTMTPDALPIEHQVLHRTYSALSDSMVSMNWVVRNYVPIGSLLVGMAYLVRRIMENSSQTGILTIMRSHLGAAPMPTPVETLNRRKAMNNLRRDNVQVQRSSDFMNMPSVEMFKEHERASIQSTMTSFKQKLSQSTHLENSFNASGETHTIYSPSDHKQVVGHVQFATIEDAQRALEMSHAAYSSGDWPISTVEERCLVMQRASLLMHAHRQELVALMVYETGKALPEAFADIDEAIDFLQYYSRSAIQWMHSDEAFSSRGPTVVISPWNFPFAIPAGMICGALLAGNTVLFKPAENASLTGLALADIFHEAGVPDDVLITLLGEGGTVGKTLAESEKIAGIVFTGSKNVGVQLWKTAAKRGFMNPLSNQRIPVRVITEMGGKNAMIVSGDADPDQVVAGVLYSTFAHAGQKCSALSRVLVHRSLLGKLRVRLTQAFEAAKVGKGEDFSTLINPLIRPSDKDRIVEVTKRAHKEAANGKGRVLVDRTHESAPGSCVGPLLIETTLEDALDPTSLAQTELFGPVLHLIPFDTVDQALEVFNATPYALTGGIYSQSQDFVEATLDKMACGNLYVNRNITGARVGIEPFGGFKLSGTGPKAGTMDYMRSFMQVALSMSSSLVGAGSVPARQPAKHDASGELNIGMSPDWSSKTPERGMLRLIKLLAGIRRESAIWGETAESIHSAFGHLEYWIEEFALNWFTKGQPNRYTPGQSSRLDMRYTKSSLVFVVDNATLRPQMVAWVFMALSFGQGVNVLCTTEAAHTAWMPVLKLVKKHLRYDEQQCVCTRAPLESLAHILEKRWPENVVLNLNDSDAKSAVHSMIVDSYEHQHHLPQIYTSSDIGVSNFPDWGWLLRQQSHVRTVVTNIMQHGAPLDLDAE